MTRPATFRGEALTLQIDIPGQQSQKTWRDLGFWLYQEEQDAWVAAVLVAMREQPDN
jgi:hypothetical protein